MSGLELDWSAIASTLAVLLLIWREFRAGLPGFQSQLVSTLKDTIEAQDRRIKQLEAGRVTDQAEIARLQGQVKLLTDILSDPARRCPLLRVPANAEEGVE